MTLRNIWLLGGFVAASACAHAQYLNHRTPGTPRSKSGKPILTAPAPRTASGKPDLSGIWQAAASPIPELMRFIAGGQNGLGEDIPSKYFIDVFADYDFGKEPLQPAAMQRAAKLSASSYQPDTPGLRCLPAGMPIIDLVPGPFKIVQTSTEILQLVEDQTTFRQIYTDERKHPVDPIPSWLGYSVGKWEADTLVVETMGLNDRSWLDAIGHTHSADLRITERFHRRDFGHMELQMTLNDPKTLTKPVTFKVDLLLLPDTDLIESYCSENEKDLAHSGLQ